MNGVHRRALGLALVGLLASACASPSPATPAPTRSISSSAPAWRGQPLSWHKLELIEAWLAGPGPADWPAYVPEAELQLAEGRLELARKDSGELATGVVDLRVTKAEAGFRRVLSSRASSADHRRRAQRGLTSATALRTPPAPVGSLAIQPRATWRARAPNAGRLTSNRRPWTRITVHHSAMPGASLEGASSIQVSDAIRRIQKVHMQEQGWGDIGYHFLIDPSGRVYQGRSLQYQGAHAGGSNNVGNIGICLLGDFDRERPSGRSLDALGELVGALSERHGIPSSRVKGHRQYKATRCPGDYLMTWVDAYARSGRRR